MINKNPYRGTRDLFPEDKRIQDFIFQKMKDTAESFGYECYDGPLLEEVDLYRAKSGEELVSKQIYSFVDRGEREVAIRPEMTPTLARMISRCHRQEIKPIRWFSIPNLMRYERPQKGRLREHWQFNCDIFGACEPYGTVEILQVLANFFKSLGAGEDHFDILLNNRETVDCILYEIIKVNKQQKERLYRIIDKVKKVSADKLEKLLEDFMLDNQQKKALMDYLNLESFEGLRDFLKKHRREQVYDSFGQFLDLAEKLSLNKFITFDPAIVRGVDYYTGFVFEVFDKHPDNPRAVCGGGHYANLLQIFNEKPLPGVGFGMGDVTLVDFLKVHHLLGDFSRPHLDLFLAFEVSEGERLAWTLANQLRGQGAKVLMGLAPVKTKRSFDIAEKKGATFIGLIGAKEIQNKMIRLKHLETRKETLVSFGDIGSMISLITRQA